MKLTKQTFDNITDNKFDIYFNHDEPEVCDLIEVSSINASTVEEGQTQPFAVVFQAPKSTTIYEQNTIKINNTELGEIVLFLVPIGSDENGVRYEAVFT